MYLLYTLDLLSVIYIFEEKKKAFLSSFLHALIIFCSPDCAIFLGENDSDRKLLCNFFAKNCSYKSLDVKTTDDRILIVSSKSITLKSFTELLLNRLLTCCNFPSIVVMLFWLSTSTDN